MKGKLRKEFIERLGRANDALNSDLPIRTEDIIYDLARDRK